MDHTHEAIGVIKAGLRLSSEAPSGLEVSMTFEEICVIVYVVFVAIVLLIQWVRGKNK